jgi:CheY-like chemotaxis protein
MPDTVRVIVVDDEPDLRNMLVECLRGLPEMDQQRNCDATKRSQIMFMDRNDILNLFIVHNVQLPEEALPKSTSGFDDDIPF